MEKDIVFLRGVHINEVSAFCLAKDVAELLKQDGYDVSLETIPRQYSFSYLAFHYPKLLLRYYDFMASPKSEGSEWKRYKRELINTRPQNEESELLENILCRQYPFTEVKKLAEKHKGKPMIDFHNLPVFSDIEREKEMNFFQLGNFHGFIYPDSEIDNLHIIEIPAIFRKLPKNILKKQKRVIKAVKMSDNGHEDTIYLEYVVDLKKSQERGLADEKAIGKIAEVIEEVVNEKNVFPLQKI